MLYYVVNMRQGFVAHEDKTEEGCNQWISSAVLYGIPRRTFRIVKGATERNRLFKEYGF